MNNILATVENSSDCVLYAMDETLLRAESDNRRTWSPVGISPILEHNGSHKGINIIGATEISKNFDTIIDAYEAKHSITFVEIQAFMENLLERNIGKKVFLILDNAKSHNCKKIQEFANAHKENLFLINTPTYSPELNPQENIWNRLKTCIFSTSARASIDDLFDDVASIYDIFNENKDFIKSIVYAKNYYD